jgi:hypothetical protein
MTPPRLANEREPLYRRVLGEAWDSLPEPLRAMHDLDGERSAGGVAVVERGSGLLARLVALVIGLPPAACSRASSSKGAGASNACCANGSDHSISAWR